MICSRSRKGSVAVRGATLAYLGLLVALPVGVLAVQVAQAGPAGVYQGALRPDRTALAQAHVHHSGGDGRDQCRDRHSDRLGAGAVSVSRQEPG